MEAQAGKGSSAQICMLETVEYVQAKIQVASFPPRRSHKPKAAAAVSLCTGTPASCWARSAARRAVLIFNLPDLGRGGMLRPVSQCGCGLCAGKQVCSLASRGRYGRRRELSPGGHCGPGARVDGRTMRVLKLSRPASKGIQDIHSVAPGFAAGLRGILKMLCDPMALLDDADKATMQSVVASLASQGDSSSSHCFTAQRVSECIEVHSGIASGNDCDSLALFYRLKLPNMLGPTCWAA
jgi:hypothetical protein